MIEYTSYKDQLTEVMKMCAEVENSVFIGQQIVWKGNPMSTTLDHVPKEKMIEVPVMEETQMGMSLGLGITGKFVVTFYPRWDFIICATNQLVNHLDKYELMTGETPHIIIRVGKGSDTPLDPGHQHGPRGVPPEIGQSHFRMERSPVLDKLTTDVTARKPSGRGHLVVRECDGCVLVGVIMHVVDRDNVVR